MPDTFDCALRTTPVQAGGETVVTGGRADAPMVEFTMAGAHLSEVQLALEQAQSCLLGETPEDMSPNEAWGDTVEKIRDALCNHIPSLCARLSPPPPDLARLRQRVEVLEGAARAVLDYAMLDDALTVNSHENSAFGIRLRELRDLRSALTTLEPTP